MTGSPLPTSPDPAMRTRAVTVRLNDAELAAWRAASKAAGRGQVGAWVRDEIATNLAEGASVSLASSVPASVSGLDPEVRKLRTELSRVGNNLNQLVRLVHSGEFDPASAPTLIEQVVETRQVIGRLRERLGYGS